MLFGAKNNSEVYEFCESPFVKQHLKYSGLRSFRLGDVEYELGDFLQVKEQKQTSFFQIRVLGYEADPRKELHPQLVIRCTKFQKASEFYAEHEGIEGHQTEPNELIEINGVYEQLSPNQIDKKIIIMTSSSVRTRQKQKNNFICNLSWHEDQQALIDYVAHTPIFCDAFVRDGMLLLIPVLYLLLFFVGKFRNALLKVLKYCFESFEIFF